MSLLKSLSAYSPLGLLYESKLKMKANCENITNTAWEYTFNFLLPVYMKPLSLPMSTSRQTFKTFNKFKEIEM